MVWLECIITAILEYQELYTGRTVHTAQSLKQDKFSTSHQCCTEQDITMKPSIGDPGHVF